MRGPIWVHVSELLWVLVKHVIINLNFKAVNPCYYIHYYALIKSLGLVALYDINCQASR